MLELKGIVKNYNRIPVVKQVSFTTRPGEILGYLRPDGAGKSTTIKMLAGLLEPDDGQILLDGRDTRQDIVAYKGRLGYIPEQAEVYPQLSGREYLQLVGRLRRCRRRSWMKKSIFNGTGRPGHGAPPAHGELFQGHAPESPRARGHIA